MFFCFYMYYDYRKLRIYVELIIDLYSYNYILNKCLYIIFIKFDVILSKLNYQIDESCY